MSGDTQSIEIVRNASLIYSKYVESTKRENARWSRVWNVQGKSYKPLDFPTVQGKSFSFIVKNAPEIRQMVDSTVSLAGLPSNKDFWLRATRFYSNMVIDVYNGWSHIMHMPGGPKGGIPVFSEGEEADSVVKFSDAIQFKNRRYLAASLSLG